MKPKQFIDRYNLDTTKFFDRNEFCVDLMDDFSKMLNSVRLTTVTFENCVNQLNLKFWNIFNGSKVDREAAEKFWRYIFAAHIVPIRNLYFPDWKKAIHEHRYSTDPDFARRYDAWKMHKEMDDEMNEFVNQARRESVNDFWERLTKNFFDMLNRLSASPSELIKAKEIFGFHAEENPSIDEIKSKYRVMAKMTHPDLGNDPTSFHALQGARDVLLRAYAVAP
jgi:hypothetical protein